MGLAALITVIVTWHATADVLTGCCASACTTQIGRLPYLKMSSATRTFMSSIALYACTPECVHLHKAPMKDRCGI